MLAKHIAHLFIRDPLVIFSETINQDDTTSNDHFEVISLFIPLFFEGLNVWAEYSIHKLADHSIQTAPTKLSHWLACRVS
jgi:hypothetical protein